MGGECCGVDRVTCKAPGNAGDWGWGVVSREVVETNASLNIIPSNACNNGKLASGVDCVLCNGMENVWIGRSSKARGIITICGE